MGHHTKTTTLDVVNDDVIDEQAANYQVTATRVADAGPSHWPLYVFEGTHQHVVAFLLDIYEVDEDELDWYIES